MSVPDAMRLILERSGRSWSLENRKRHVLLRVEGRAVLVMPRTSKKSDDRAAERNAAACLRRHLRTLGDGAEKKTD